MTSPWFIQTTSSILMLFPSLHDLELTPHSTTSLYHQFFFSHKITMLEKCSHTLYPNQMQLEIWYLTTANPRDPKPSDKTIIQSSSFILDGNSCDIFPNCSQYHQMLYLLCPIFFTCSHYSKYTIELILVYLSPS